MFQTILTFEIGFKEQLMEQTTIKSNNTSAKLILYYLINPIIRK